MSTFNRATILGRLGADPDTRSIADTTVAALSVATNTVWTDKQGTRQERTQWHRVKVWGRQAEICRDYLSKGSMVLIDGSLETHKYDDAQGITRFVTEIKAKEVRLVGGKSDNERSPKPATNASQTTSEPTWVPDSEVPF